MQSDQRFETGWRCPLCDAPLHGMARDCTSCGQAQAVRLARLLTELERATRAAAHTRAEVDAYLAEARGLRQQPRPQGLAPGVPMPPMAPGFSGQPAPAGAARLPAPPAVSGAGRPARRLSPQAALLGLGVLLVMAAAVTFLAVVWSRLGLTAQTLMMAVLGLGFVATSVPASRRRLSGTAEAFAVLGFGVLAAVGIAARARGLLPAGDTHTYAGLSCAVLALVCLAMHRTVPAVRTYGVAGVLVAQAPVTLLLAGVADPAALLLAVGGQALVTARLTLTSVEPVRLTGAACALAGLVAATLVALGRTLLGLTGEIGQFPATASAVVAVVLAATGVVMLERHWLGVRLPRPASESACAATAACAAGAAIAQVPVTGAWAVTGLAAMLAVTELMRRTRRVDWVLRPMAVTAVAVLAGLAVVVSVVRADLRQLAAIALLAGATALLARYRKRIAPAAATVIACLAPVVAVALLSGDGVLTPWTGGLVCAVLAAGMVSIAGRRRGHPDEAAAVASWAGAVLVAVCMMVAVSNQTGVGLVLVVVAGPLLAYGRLPRRRPALLVAVLMLTIANTLLASAADVRVLEPYTLPPALLMLAVGRFGPKDDEPRSSWLTLGPGLLVGLLPSSVLVIGSGDPVRLGCVVAAAVGLVVAGTRFSLQAPFVIGAGVLAKLGIWQLVLVTPQFPRWVSLGLAGAVLLVVGATYERRIADARRTARWVAQLR